MELDQMVVVTNSLPASVMKHICIYYCLLFYSFSRSLYWKVTCSKPTESSVTRWDFYVHFSRASKTLVADRGGPRNNFGWLVNTREKSNIIITYYLCKLMM
jgi:hypothetical protein